MSELERIILSETPNEPLPWHALPDDLVLLRLQATMEGLEPEQVQERQEEFGRNMLPERKPPTLLEIVLHQFKSPLIYILLIAGVVALLTGDLKDAVFILAVILLNAGIGSVQEWRAEQSAHALQKMLKVRARVRRAGQQQTLDAEELVPGDVVLLESGDRVPADLRLMQITNLAIDESFLTGESLPANKKLIMQERRAPVSDRLNMAYAGSTVVSGRAIGLVVATGRYTQVGQIARAVAEEEGAKPPLVVRMEKFARQISVIVLVFAGLLGVVAFARGMVLNEVLFLVIAMSVSAIPEGLPVAMTVALSVSTRRMAQRHVIVRRLASVESLGSCTVIASDKTGTLTVNQQTVRSVILPGGEHLQVSGEGYNADGAIALQDGGAIPAELLVHLQELARHVILCNEAELEPAVEGWSHSGDAMDIALLSLSYKLGLKPAEVRLRHTRLAELPFESEKRFSASLIESDSGGELIVKGAVETVLTFCSHLRTSQGVIPMDAELVTQQALSLAKEGYRVLAVASGAASAESRSGVLDERLIAGLALEALVGFIDPLRPEASAAVETALDAGIRVVMITGDHPATALAIARQLGIAASKDQVVTGQELAEIGDVHVPQFYERVKHAAVFARVSPEQKLHIVDALMALGNFVAVTGDGVNDAPALRKANIGIAMGSGTDVAKDTASLIVTDDNFASIVAGIEEGRHAYANVRKVTLLLISTGLAELILIGLSIVAALPIPLLAVQILWLNLVTNGIQDVALAFESGEKGVMRLPPRRPAEGLFNRKMIEQVLLSGGIMALVCFAAWVWMNQNGWEVSAARSSLLTLLVLMQFYHVLNCRSEFTSVFRIPLRNNPVLVAGMAIAFVVHILAVNVPFLQDLLRTQPLPVWYWWIFAALGSLILLVVEFYKLLNNKRRAK